MGTINVVQSRDLSFTLFVTDAKGHPFDLSTWSMARLRLPASAGGYVEKFAPLIAAVNEVQLLTFDDVPDAGTFTLKLGGEETDPLDFDATAADIQTALRALKALSTVTVTGDFAGGFTVSFVGNDGGRNQPLVAVTNASTLKVATVLVVPTVAVTTEGVAASGLDMAQAVSGLVAVTLSEADTAALRVGTKQSMDLQIRLGAKDLNVPIVTGALNVVKSPFA